MDNKNKYNLIFISLDAIRSSCLEHMPHTQKLIQKSSFFPTNISPAPYTLGCLHTSMSGIYPHYNGINGYYRMFRFKKDRCKTLAQYLKDQNYYCVAESHKKGVLPPQGFDEVNEYDETKEDLSIRHKDLIDQVSQEHKNFFIYLFNSKVHYNLVKQIAKKYDDLDEQYFKARKDNESLYIQMLEEVDTYVKEIVEHIEKSGLAKNTIFILDTDHGVSLGDKFGEKMYGSFLYDYTLITFLILYQKDLFPNKKFDSLTSKVDILPTLLDLFSLTESNKFEKIQGISLKPLLREKGTVDSDRVVFSETGGLGGKYPSPEKHNMFAARTSDWKLIYNSTANEYELYHLSEDPEEENNLDGSGESMEEKLKKSLQKHFRI